MNVNVQRPKIYCGDNQPPDEDTALGTRYQCLRKGVGAGLYIVAPAKLKIYEIARLLHVNTEENGVQKEPIKLANDILRRLSGAQIELYAM